MRKFLYLACISGILLSPTYIKAISPEDSVNYINWQNQDSKLDKTYGISTDRAYNELLKGKTSKTVIVAVIDNGVDINHIDLKDNIWVNEDEIPGNGIDDDNNGYIDDLNGWNFIGNSKGENIVYAPLEVTRLYKEFQKKYNDFNDSAIEADTAVDLEYLNKIRYTFEEKSFEATFSQSNFLSFLKIFNRYDSILLLALNKKEYTIKELKAFKPIKNSSADSASSFMKKVAKKGINMSVIKEAMNYFSSKVDYQYNLDFNPRIIIGDDYTIWSDTAYGNNDVRGQSPDHGTMVSGIIGATRNNGLGINGIADNVKIMAIRTVPDGDEYDKDVASAIKYAIDNGAQIINMSFGKSFSPQKQFVDNVVKLADEKNVLLIHAAGNDNEDVDVENNFPNQYAADGSIEVNNWMTIGANTKSNKKKQFVADFSNYGKKNVDLFAPGFNIITCTPDNKYDMASGTSFSAPTVTGAAALVKEYYPELTAAQLKDILMKSVEKPAYKVILPGTSGKSKKIVPFDSLSVTGGVVNVYNALILADQLTTK